jgi:SPP1 family predicted phage head-tail adaptor
MKKIGGNIEALIQRKTSTKNEYGEGILTWTDVDTLKGFLDLSTGGATYTTYNSKIVESTHVFVCDYKELSVNEEEIRMIINNKVYDITYIDNPMELNYHLEFYLKYIGGVQNV